MSHENQWLPATEWPAIHDADIHLWFVDTAEHTAQATSLRALLNADERVRADRFYFAVDRIRFTIGRALLRSVLARYLAIDPAEIGLAYGARGKPELAEPTAASGIRFNLSHAGPLFLVAVGLGRHLGVDIELLSPRERMHQLAEKIFSPAEVGRFRQLAPTEQLAVFYRGWTQREALLKARGDGLGGPFTQIECHDVPGTDLVHFTIRDQPEESQRWSLMTFSPRPDCVASLAFDGKPGLICKWRGIDTPKQHVEDQGSSWSP